MWDWSGEEPRSVEMGVLSRGLRVLLLAPFPSGVLTTEAARGLEPAWGRGKLLCPDLDRETGRI